ncbi:regulator of chromosome condensation 1/beta-lactamase-inhibitor protein II [Boeremia exigua]|uniref:regulator of chromosome condensation 1/beta-lactamase-inhibitor protein II n=1 Tax=Boeremia exigua TaxID=749465 RepID=UPI001E8CD44B|nr:regulator of chromosome condensation 1/beta-lactamase-inhibitor protein II [Boeremia exigua]KAH6642199.1 regulator of chromosome condensation 1/beta-lactamase-inhibitor protein II [Boeremia exigua]
MTDKTTSITDLPLDIIVLIFPYLDAKSFLSLCSTCKALQQPSIRLDPAYWSFATRSTFRVPNQPVVQHDGLRWQKLYRRMLTQSHVYTWGHNGHNRLGHSFREAIPGGSMLLPRRPLPRRLRGPVNCSFPTEMEDTRQLGVIADMQCGGWSTTLLNADGILYTAGMLDGQVALSSNEGMRRLTFPTGFQYSINDPEAHEPSIAIRQFSAGRSHILGLSDTGKIWSWYNSKNAALQVKFAHVELNEQAEEGALANKGLAFGHVRQVVAGWSRSSAYVQGVGIIVWDVVQRGSHDSEMDTMLVLENAEVPKSGYRRPKGKERETNDQSALGEEVGVVVNHIILEHFVVFATDIGKVFCGLFGDKNRVDQVLELSDLRNEHSTAIDIQGSFRRFAVFKNGEVITADQEYLHQCWNARGTNLSFRGLNKIPALQHNDVISVAFGDYHYIALHSDGKITSYGTELQACGALGLGEEGPQGKARGIAYDRISHEGRLLSHAYTCGRQVWFDSRKKDWIQSIIQNAPNENEEARARADRFENELNVQGEVSEWIEQESREWDKDSGDDGLGAYFALRVSAAGWHSGALVLVNDELARKEPSYSYDGKSFPRLQLSDGTEMPGSGDLDIWRHGRPDWQLDAVQ